MPTPIQRVREIRDEICAWLNGDENSNQWADDLNGPYCIRAVPFNIPALRDGVADQFNIFNGTDSGKYYSVWTNWNLTDIKQRQYQFALDVCVYPEQFVPRLGQKDEGYEVRIFFRAANQNHNISRPTVDQARRFLRICAGLNQYGFKDNTPYVGGRFDYVRVFHKPVTLENIKIDLAPYIGRYEGEGRQHLKPYINEIIRDLSTHP